jgi:hypothetical protein
MQTELVASLISEISEGGLLAFAIWRMLVADALVNRLLDEQAGAHEDSVNTIKEYVSTRQKETD